MNNTKSNVNVKIDANVKEAAIQLLGRMGLDQTTAIELFYRQIIAERRLPFQPTVSPQINEKTLDEQIIEAALRRNPKRVTLQTNEKGQILIEKELHPDIYDWAVNG